MDIDLIRRHSAPVPRYTSYPTANHFTPAVQPLQYVDWLSSIAGAARLSLYLHVPFCQALCWYCACSTKAVQRYEPVERYLRALSQELANVAALLPRPHRVVHMHWGGGSPSILRAPDIQSLAHALRRHFTIDDQAEMAVEIDPRDLEADQVEAFAAAGFNRVSLGVQDFDPAVQAAIGRLQSFEATRRAIGLFRERGVNSINIDLVYGLPFQTEATLRRTIASVIELAPDRIAAFGYAHLPARAPAQRLIDASALPDMVDRFAQSVQVANLLQAAGYARVGIDHFARARDELVTRPLRRNFQGYTSDPADVLLGFGASAIGQLPDGFVQNAVPVHDYERRIAEAGVATARGRVLTDDDRMRAFVIERLMCEFELPAAALLGRFGEAARPLLAEAARIAALDDDGLTAVTATGFEVTARGRPFVRDICARFDRYLDRGNGRHAPAV